ncbi:hypothetical protein L596_004857 [Steinernema carpocapsae]|uniref:Uncharacterized protein n=1 Tax=Steinernema carpocapsae TaxID=34508 RepID=A0A4U8UY60_STECR|nr:hypothetical protein L596_004857 [Steinernema carpocapsae]
MIRPRPTSWVVPGHGYLRLWRPSAAPSAGWPRVSAAAVCGVIFNFGCFLAKPPILQTETKTNARESKCRSQSIVSIFGDLYLDTEMSNVTVFGCNRWRKARTAFLENL